MTIVTSSYTDWRPRMGVPVRITLGSPRQPHPAGFGRWPFVAELAPKGWYLNAAPEKFERAYVSQLEQHADDIGMKLRWLLDEYGDIALCCFERSSAVLAGTSYCHRRTWAGWWSTRTGQVINEGGLLCLLSVNAHSSHPRRPAVSTGSCTCSSAS